MKWHDCKTDKPKKDGVYATVTVYGKDVRSMSNIDYSVRYDGWNVDWFHDRPTREHELYPTYWSEMPTLDELAGDLNEMEVES